MTRERRARDVRGTLSAIGIYAVAILILLVVVAAVVWQVWGWSDCVGHGGAWITGRGLPSCLVVNGGKP